jgi:hypothetical protein
MILETSPNGQREEHELSSFLFFGKRQKLLPYNHVELVWASFALGQKS